VETNIVVLTIPAGPVTAAQVASEASAAGVRVSVLGRSTARLVTHLDVDDAGVDRACEVLAGIAARAR
jgi:threonine aldolase